MVTKQEMQRIEEYIDFMNDNLPNNEEINSQPLFMKKWHN
jgi:Tfp pilus assembly protein PilO